MLNSKGFVVWWAKKDLRLSDNEALANAFDFAFKQNLGIVSLWIEEPETKRALEYHPRRQKFISDSLRDLAPRLERLGASCLVAHGTADDVFKCLLSQGLKAVFCHEETGELWTYQRDSKVLKLLRENNVPIWESPTNGVVRRLKSRDEWKSIYDQRMFTPLASDIDTPLIHAAPYSWPLQTSKWSNWTPQNPHTAVQQAGGEGMAWSTLRGFFSQSDRYLKSISDPVLAARFGSRLSPYLALGNISVRQVRKEWTHFRSDDRSRSAFLSRLAWRCHFIQKLEDFPRLECEEVNPEYKGLRETMNAEEVQRFTTGETGFPFVDACLRSLHATGFLNFRMRAMLMSFATHLMWRDWRDPAHILAKAFLDFEPGIHYAQAQMQASVTGNNQIRIYSPLKQGLEFDPDGKFMRTWVPELKHASAESLHTLKGLPSQYPQPIVEFDASYFHAKSKLFEKIREPEVRKEAKMVQEKLGSRSRNSFKASVRNDRKQAPLSSSKTKQTAQEDVYLCKIFDEES